MGTTITLTDDQFNRLFGNNGLNADGPEYGTADSVWCGWTTFDANPKREPVMRDMTAVPPCEGPTCGYGVTGNESNAPASRRDVAKEHRTLNALICTYHKMLDVRLALLRDDATEALHEVDDAIDDLDNAMAELR